MNEKQGFNDQLGIVSTNANNQFRENSEAISQLRTEVEAINAPPIQHLTQIINSKPILI